MRWERVTSQLQPLCSRAPAAVCISKQVISFFACKKKSLERKNTLLIPRGKLNLRKRGFANVSPLVQRHLGRIYRYATAGHWTWSIPSRPTRSVVLIFFSWFLNGEETGVPGENPRCQVGTINPTDMPDGSGQQLTVATIVPRPGRRTTWPA